MAFFLDGIIKSGGMWFNELCVSTYTNLEGREVVNYCE